MRGLLRPMLPMIVVLAIPIIPFLLFGAQLEAWWHDWQQGEHSREVIAAVVVGLLSTDIFLPVPSSVVSTLAGWKLGTLGGTATSWLGMTIGAVIGFALARKWGRPLVTWLTRPTDLQRTARLVELYGPLLLVIGRGVPVLAEATVLILGMHDLPWRRFLPPVLLSNLGLALAYAAFGEFAAQHGWLPLALGVAIALPVLMATLFRLFTRPKTDLD